MAVRGLTPRDFFDTDKNGARPMMANLRSCSCTVGNPSRRRSLEWLTDRTVPCHAAPDLGQATPLVQSKRAGRRIVLRGRVEHAVGRPPWAPGRAPCDTRFTRTMVTSGRPPKEPPENIAPQLRQQRGHRATHWATIDINWAGGAAGQKTRDERCRRNRTPAALLCWAICTTPGHGGKRSCRASVGGSALQPCTPPRPCWRPHPLPAAPYPRPPASLMANAMSFSRLIPGACKIATLGCPATVGGTAG